MIRLDGYTNVALAPKRPQSHEADFSPPQGKKVRMVASSEEALSNMAHQADAYMGVLVSAGPKDSPNYDMVDEIVRARVDQLISRLEGHDALDVLSMVRQFLLPPDFAHWQESGSSVSDSWATAEVVALVLLGLGLPNRSDDCEVPTSSIIPELIRGAATIVRLSLVKNLMRAGWVEAEDEPDAALRRIASKLSSHETAVRGRQYIQVAQKINEAVLSNPGADGALMNALRFTYSDVLKVRDHIARTLAKRHEEIVATLGTQTFLGVPSKKEFEGFQTMFETPSDLFVVHPEEVGDESGIDTDLFDRVMRAFSVSADGRSSHELVSDFCNGRNPMAGKAVVRAPSGEYLVLPGAIAEDEIRRNLEDMVKGTSSWSRYDKARAAGVEALVGATFADIIEEPGNVYPSLYYRFSDDTRELGRSSETHNTAGLVEADCLVVADGVAFCVEVKAGSFRAKSRQGASTHLGGDLEKTILGASRQALRLQSLIEANGGVWCRNGVWLDLANVREVYPIVICLDDLGPVSLSTFELVNVGVLSRSRLPWVVSVHDFLVCAEVLDIPGQLLSYVRRRTSESALRITGSDELDLLMWYVTGGFFLEESEEENQDGPLSIIVGTLTDSLDAYYYSDAGLSSEVADIPRRRELPTMLDNLFYEMMKKKASGWLRGYADFDSLAPDSQEEIEELLGELLDQSASDGKFHTLVTGGSGERGQWLAVFGSGVATPSNFDRLRLYAEAKKYQTLADRALVAFLGDDSRPRATAYLSDPHSPDERLSELVNEMGLTQEPTSWDSAVGGAC